MDPDGVLHTRPGIGRQAYNPAMEQLERAAGGDCDPATCFDGAPIVRREGPLAILKEEKTAEWRTYPGYRRIGGCHRGGRYHDFDCGPDFVYEPPKVVREYRQTVGIADREGYVREERSGGRLLGGILGGVLGLIGLLAGPLAVATVAAGALTGYLVGGSVAASKAEGKPRVFERTQRYEEIV
jgi:hypothetical protein